MFLLKKENGITLVALVISIIVLLILATVSINLVINNGILDKAKTAVDKYSDGEIEEQIKLAYQEWQMGQYSGITDDVATFIKTKLQGIFGSRLNDNSVRVVNKKIIAKIDNKIYEYNITTGISMQRDTLLEDIIEDNYGDYIDLGQDVIGTTATSDDWRILYNDKNGHIYAILADYLPNSNLAVTASGLNVLSERTYNVNSTTRDDFLGKLNSTTAWQSLIPEVLRSTCQVKGATTGEILMASYNEKYGTSLEYTSRPTLRTNPNDITSPIDTLYMPHPGWDAYDNCSGYWLASTYADDLSSMWYVLCSGTVYARTCSYNGFGVRPVVSLPSNILITSTTSNGITIWSLKK